MLLGLEKKRKEEEEELGSTYDLRSQALRIDEAGKPFVCSLFCMCFLESFILSLYERNVRSAVYFIDMPALMGYFGLCTFSSAS